MESYKQVDESFESTLEETTKHLHLTFSGPPVWREMHQIVRERSIRAKLDADLYEERLYQVHDFLKEVAIAFSRSIKSTQKHGWEKEIIWYHRKMEQALMPTKTSGEIGKALGLNKAVSGDDVLECVMFYLARPWMQHNGFDWVFLDALIYSEIEAFREGIYTGQTWKNKLVLSFG